MTLTDEKLALLSKAATDDVNADPRMEVFKQRYKYTLSEDERELISEYGRDLALQFLQGVMKSCIVRWNGNNDCLLSVKANLQVWPGSIAGCDVIITVENPKEQPDAVEEDPTS